VSASMESMICSISGPDGATGVRKESLVGTPTVVAARQTGTDSPGLRDSAQHRELREVHKPSPRELAPRY